jgi:hypothetical protein
MSAHWTRDAIEALGPTTNVETAASVLDVSPSLAYELIRRKEEAWPTRVLRLGRTLRIPTHDLIVLLYGPSDMTKPASSTDAGPLANTTPNQKVHPNGNSERSGEPQHRALR